jgi:hypothetical protein
MEILFDIAGTPAKFRRSNMTGRARLEAGSRVVTLQSPFRLSTHFFLARERTLRCRIGEHDIEIVMVRQTWLGGSARFDSRSASMAPSSQKRSPAERNAGAVRWTWWHGALWRCPSVPITASAPGRESAWAFWRRLQLAAELLIGARAVDLPPEQVLRRA